MSGMACQPWQGAQRPAPQAVPLCLRLLALVALSNWVAFESTKGKMVPVRKGRLRASPLESLSCLSIFGISALVVVVVAVAVFTLASWALWDGVLPACCPAAKLAGEGRVESGGEAGSARPPCWVAATEFSRPPPSAPEACGLPPCLGSCSEKYAGAAAPWLGARNKGPGPLGLLCL